MRATPGIKWLIVSLGFVCHSIYLNTAAESTTETPTVHNDTNNGSKDGDIATNTTATTVPSAATTASITTSQNNIIAQRTTVQTPKATQTIPATTENTPTDDAPRTGTTPTASMTSSTNTVIQAVIITSTLASAPMTATATTSATPSPGPVLNPQPTTATTSAYSLATKTAYNMSSQNVSEEQHKSTSSPTAQASKAVTAVTMEQMISTEASIKIPESTAGLAGTTATTHLRNVGVSSTSYGTSSGTSFSVNKGVNAATTDSAMQASTATASIETPTFTQKFVYSHKDKLQTKEKDEEKNLRKVCKRLMESMENGSCTLNWLIQNGAVKIQSVEINAKVNESLAQQYYDELSEKEHIKTDNKTLIAILASCGALLIMIVILGACASHHRKPYNENQQHLTEELHTVENGYHDNPTLDVMEVQPEMLEKKMVLNGEFNDSWMVPLDHLSKEDHPEEEDTHL